MRQELKKIPRSDFGKWLWVNFNVHLLGAAVSLGATVVGIVAYFLPNGWWLNLASVPLFLLFTVFNLFGVLTIREKRQDLLRHATRYEEIESEVQHFPVHQKGLTFAEAQEALSRAALAWARK